MSAPKITEKHLKILKESIEKKKQYNQEYYKQHPEKFQKIKKETCTLCNVAVVSLYHHERTQMHYDALVAMKKKK
jgi:hypothetical protein